MIDSVLHQYAPQCYRTPLVQTVCLGLVFFLVFAAYTTIQFYASSNYGPTLAANSVSAVYGTFTLSCLVAPSIVNHLGSRRAMLVGILGYAALVICSLLYFVGAAPSQVVVIGGAVLGVGAALLWTAQGRMILQYDTKGGGTAKLVGIFWAVFQCSSLVGGAISFAYYNQERPTGSVALYAIFLSFILMGAFLTQFLLPPSMLLSEATTTLCASDERVTNESTNLLSSLEPIPVRAESALASPKSFPSWSKDVTDTLRLFTTKPMQLMLTLFFYTGYNQPYQQATFNRFFTKRSIGIELILFHFMEIVGALIIGRVLDLSTSSVPPVDQSGRLRSIGCLVMFALVNAVANLLAFVQELKTIGSHTIVTVDIGSFKSVGPSIAFMLWGLADSSVQVYCYWWIGSMYSTGDDHSRAVGFYKCVQSMGYTLGFYFTPTDTRLPGLHQLLLSTGVFIVGTALAFSHLPGGQQRGSWSVK